MMRSRGQPNSNPRISHEAPILDSASSTKRATFRHSSLLYNVTFQRNILALICALLLCYELLPLSLIGKVSLRGASDCLLYFGEYRGPQYYSPESGSVLSPKCLVESKWLKLSQHSVQFPGSSNLFDDWMWIDYHDRINVLVEAKPSVTGERQFLVFDQTKYALEGRSSKAIIGGIIEPGETAETAARREVEEEMNGLTCKEFHFLGRYRTDVNRGMGWVNGFLATDCDHSKPLSKHTALADEVGAADTERQDLTTITINELRNKVRQGAFIEVQWTAAVALALLHPELSSAS